MCGIVAAFNRKKNVNEDVLLQFEDQSTRGTNGFGSMLIDETGKFKILRATGQIKAILDVKLNPTKQLIFHHRQPSSSKNKISQTHPIKISSGDLKYDYYIVHNGVIQNDDARKAAHEKDLGYHYSTEAKVDGWYGKSEIMFNDSECLGYDIARFIEGQTDAIKTIGSAAFIIAQVTKKGQKIRKVFFGRNAGNPLKLEQTEDSIFLSSEGPGEVIEVDRLYSFTPAKQEIYEQEISIKTSSYKSSASTDSAAEEKATNKTEVLSAKDDDDDFDRFDSYNGFNHYAEKQAKGYAGTDDDEWMSWEEEETLEKYFTDARNELNELEETIKLATKGEELYLLEAEDVVRSIAVNVSRAVEYARNLRISSYMTDLEDDALARGGGEDYPGQEQDAEKILEGEIVDLPSKTSSK